MKLWKSERSSARAKPPRRFVAVDFDSQSLRLVSVQRNGRGPKCKGFHVEAMGDASPDDPQAVGEVLARAMHACKLGKLPVVMTIPRDKAVLKPLRLPPGTPASDIAGMVQFQASAEGLVAAIGTGAAGNITAFPTQTSPYLHILQV